METTLAEASYVHSEIIKRLLQQTAKNLGLLPSELQKVERLMHEQLEGQATQSEMVRYWLLIHEEQADFQPLTPELFKEARLHLGLTAQQYATVCGFKKSDNAFKYVHALERGDKPITDVVSRVVRALLSGHRPPDWPEKQYAD